MRAPDPPPACPDGWSCAPPDFVGVGAQRCGTTRWHNLILSHPRVTPAPRKELHFFDSLLGAARPKVSTYASYFPRPDGTLCGEWTPRYMLDHWVPPLLARAAPGARILVSLRDPIARYVSGMAHSARLGAEKTQALGPDSPIAAVARGFYAQQLDTLARHFRREHVLVLQFERCVDDAAGELRRTFAFLGLDPDEAPLPDSRAVNVSAGLPRLPARERAELVARYEEDVRALAPYGIDPALWPNFRHLG